MENTKNLLGQIVLRLGLALTLIVVLGWQWQHFMAQPRHFVPELIRVPLGVGEARVLGRNEIAAHQADTAHLRVRRDESGAWWMANVSENRAVEVQRGDSEALMHSLTLVSGQHIAVVGQSLEVIETAPRLILQDAAGVRWAYDGKRLFKNGEALPRCPENSWLNSINRNTWNSFAPAALLQLPTGMELGGLLACANRLPLAGVARESARIALDHGRFVLNAGNATGAARAVCVDAKSGGNCAQGKSLYALEQPLQGVDSLVIGRTLFAVSIAGDELQLKPKTRVRLFDSASPTVPDGLSWQMTAVDVWHWPVASSPWPWLAAWGLLVVMFSVVLQRHYRIKSDWLVLNISVGCGMVLLGVLAKWAGGALGVGWSLGLITLTAGLMVFVPQRSLLQQMTLALFTLLLCIGLATQFALGLAADESLGLQFFQSNAAVASAGLAVLFVYLQLLSADRLKKISQQFMEKSLLLLALAALGSLLLEVLFGNEAGVFGVQPVELAKLALVLLAAHVLALRLDWNSEPSWSRRIWLWWRYLLPLLVFVALVAMALFLAHDFSPVVLMCSLLVGLTLAWSFASGRSMAFMLAVVLLSAGTYAIWAAHEHGAEWLGSIGLYSDRIEVWVNLGLHPHNGEQLRRGMALAVDGGLHGVEAAHPWYLPEVQNDFAPDYFLSRFGAIGGAVLFGLQMLYLGCLLTVGWNALQVGSGNCRATLIGRLRFFALWGAAAMLFGHFAVSWGTNLGWLPVMGQPMPFVSAAGSLLAFFLFPLQLLYVSNLTNDKEQKS